MARILIVGYGNPLRSDDGMGAQAALRLLQAPLPPGTEVLVRNQLTPEIAETVSRADLVIFIDARRGESPGDVHCAPVGACDPVTTFTHHLTPSTVLFLAGELYGVCPRAYEVSLDGQRFDLGEKLSDNVAEQIPLLVEVVRNLSAAPGISTPGSSALD